MGKIRTKVLGLEQIEEEQKKKRREQLQQKKARQSAQKIRAQGLKGGERMVEVQVKEKDIEKMEKVKKIMEEKAEIKKPAAIKRPKTEKKRGKNYQNAKKSIEKDKKYSLLEAVKLLKKIKYTKFPESVELHLNVDKVGLKGEVELPYSTGKKLRVRIVDDKTLTEIEQGRIEFDILIAHPSFMVRLAKFAKVLGPKGLMPNPKTGTVTDNPEAVAKKFEKGSLHWKTEPKFPLIHQMIGKLDFDEQQLVANASAFLKSVGKAHTLSAFIKSTMSPSVKLDLEKI